MRARSRVSPHQGQHAFTRLERDWATVLNLDNSVVRWVFEGARLRLAKGAYYTPDFLVFKENRLIEMHETKGFMREAARVRLLTAAELYPEFMFVLITRGKSNGMWNLEQIAGHGDEG